MAQLGRIDYTFLTATGLPVVGATVEVRKPGAQIKTGGPNVFTVDDPGGLLVNDNCVLNNSTSPVRAVTAVGATSVTVGAGGFTPTVDDDRISVASPLVTIYSDAVGTDTMPNPLTTDNKGRVVCYAVGGKYDLLATAPLSYNLQPQLVQDIVAEGAEARRSNIFPSASSVAYETDTLRAQVSGSKLERWLSAGSEKFYIDLDASLNPRLPAHHVIGPLTVDSGGIVVTSGTTAVQALTATTGLFSSTLGVSGLLSANAGLSVSGGSTTLRADLSSGSPTSLDLQDDTPTTTLRISADSGGGALVNALDRVLTLTSGAASGSRVQVKASASLGSNPVLEVLEGSGVRFEAGFSDGHVRLNSASSIFTGSGSPEGAVTAPVSSIFLRTNGGANTTLYVKESGSGNTGWVPK